MQERGRCTRASAQGLLLAISTGLVICCLTGCDESVNPFIESDRIFSVYGALDMGADTQWVRVVPIDTSLFVEAQPTIDARVFITDVTTGQQQEWTDSLFTFRDGSKGHVFYAPLRVQPDHTYRLEFTRSDGQTATAETTIPPTPTVTVGEPQRFSSPSGVVDVNIPVTWGVDRAPAAIRTWYRFSLSAPSHFVDIGIDYPTADINSEPGWTVLVLMTKDRQVISEKITPESFFFLGMGMQIVVYDEKFVPPGGVFDPDVLAQPGTLSNVEQGFGFIGSIGRFDTQWVVDERTARDLGYILPKTLPSSRPYETLHTTELCSGPPCGS